MVLKTRQLERDAKRTAIDRLLLLHVHASVEAAGGGSLGATLLQKIVFQCQLRLRTKGASLQSWAFRRWTYGPYSPELASDESTLKASALLTADHLSDRGRRILEAFVPALLPANRTYFEVIHEEAAKRAKWTAARAKREAYELKVTVESGATVTMAEAPTGMEFDLDPVGKIVPFVLDDEYLAAELQMEFGLPHSEVVSSRVFTNQTTRGTREFLSGRGE